MLNIFKKSALIFSTAFLIVAVGIFLFMYQFIKKNTETSKNIETELQAEISKRKEVESLNNYFVSIQKEKNLFETHFVQSSNVVPFLDTLENAAESVGTKMEVGSLDLKTGEEQGFFVEITDRGDFGQVYKFLTLLENAPYELEFISVDFHRVLDEEILKEFGKGRLWEAVLKLKVVSFI